MMDRVTSAGRKWFRPAGELHGPLRPSRSHVRSARLTFVALATWTLLTQPAHAADAPQNITWATLVPADKPQTRPPKPFFAGATPALPGQAVPGGTGHEPSTVQGDAKWMSGASKAPNTNTPAPVVAELNGKRVKIGGYVVPLDFDATKVTEFLLVPFVGACIHVPPPPP